MPRSARAELEAGLYHVFARGNAKQAIFLDRSDRLTYLRLLEREIRRTGWRCLAYCLMNNHVHLLIETAEPNLGEGMKRFHGRYAQIFNGRHRRVGHLFQGRFGAVPIRSDEQLFAVIGYIAANPIKAGLCPRAEDWRWSSHRAVVGTVAPPPWLDVARLLSLFGSSGGQPLRRYLELTSPSPAET